MSTISKTDEVAIQAPAGSALTFEETLHSLLNEALTTTGATGGSIMLLDDLRERLVIQARLGRPHLERRYETRFDVGDISIAGYVAKTGESHRSQNIENDPHFSPPRSGKLHFRSILCVPILNAEGVVLGVLNADHEQKDFFKSEHEIRLKDLAHPLSAVIMERNRLWLILDSLHDVGTSLARLSQEGRLADGLKNIAEQALDLLGADVVTLYQYDQSHKHFLVEGTGPTISGRLNVPGPMHTRIYPDDIPSKMVQQGESHYFLDVENDNFMIGKVPPRDGHPERPRFAVREGIKSVAALVLRAGTEIVGIMFANYRYSHEFTDDEKRILETFANYAAIAIKNAQLLEELKQVQEQRLAAERWATLGKAAGNLAHRINNTAGLVPVAVQDLKELLTELTMPDDLEELINSDLMRIERNTQFTLELADALLKPFKSGSTQQLDLNKLLKETVSLSEIPSTVKLDLNLGPDLPLITSSPLLVDVFVELISND